MSLILFGLIAAAAAGATGVVAARVIAKRRADRKAAEEPPKLLPAPGQGDGPERHGLAVGVGDVVQFGSATRWPKGGLVLRTDTEEVVGAVLVSKEGGTEQATVALSAPDRTLLWLERISDVALPATPPSRIEIKTSLLDRERALPVTVTAEGTGAPEVGDNATLAVYKGAMGDAAVLLDGDAKVVWYGQRVPEGDYDNLGQVED